MTTLHYIRRTGQRHGREAGPSLVGLGRERGREGNEKALPTELVRTALFAWSRREMRDRGWN